MIKFENYQVYDIEKLFEAPWNYKKDDHDLSKKLAKNIKRNGQIENILIRELKDGSYEVVNGNHRYRAMKELGAKKIIAYNLGKISLSEAKRIAYETNETKFKADDARVQDLFFDILQDFDKKDLLSTMPIGESQIDEFINNKQQIDDLIDDEQESKQTKEDEKEKFRQIKISLPLEVADLFMDQVSRLKNVFKEYSGDDSNDVFPYEIMAIFINDMSDDQLKHSIFGNE